MKRRVPATPRRTSVKWYSVKRSNLWVRISVTNNVYPTTFCTLCYVIVFIITQSRKGVTAVDAYSNVVTLVCAWEF